MTKNVTVTDANGNYIGTTYPKRARGLIKNGRALFVDDCTIRLSADAEPSDIYHTSEVTQMNTIYFNPRNWSFEQTQYNSQNSFLFSHTGSMNRGTGYTQPVRAERSFINDFDNGLVESLLFGHWDAPAVTAVSSELFLTPDTAYRFVFWLNGGENDKSSEICQLRIIFSGSPEDCYTYNLNRNYIKPLLHRDGWELYSIPFQTPAASSAMQGTSEPSPAVAVRLAFVAENAPMAIKPAKEPEAYADWEDAPDAFAGQRPQRHNLVFEDGWPSISQYGGGNYSTEVLRAKKKAAEARCANRFSDTPHNAAGSLGSINQSVADTAAGIASHPRVPSTSDIPSTLADDLAEHLEDIEKQRDDLLDLTEGLKTRVAELVGRAKAMAAQGLLAPDAMDDMAGRISAFANGLSRLEYRVKELDQQVDNTDCEIEMRGMSSDDGNAYLDSLESQLDAEESHADAMEESLDSLEECLDSLEDSAAE